MLCFSRSSLVLSNANSSGRIINSSNGCSKFSIFSISYTNIVPCTLSASASIGNPRPSSRALLSPLSHSPSLMAPDQGSNPRRGTGHIISRFPKAASSVELEVEKVLHSSLFTACNLLLATSKTEQSFISMLNAGTTDYNWPSIRKCPSLYQRRSSR